MECEPRLSGGHALNQAMKSGSNVFIKGKLLISSLTMAQSKDGQIIKKPREPGVGAGGGWDEWRSAGVFRALRML